VELAGHVVAIGLEPAVDVEAREVRACLTGIVIAVERGRQEPDDA
jgi:hypothetical protein